MAHKIRQPSQKWPTYDVGQKAEGTVLEPLGELDGGAGVAEAVESPLAQDDDAGLEAAQEDGTDVEDRLADVVAPVRHDALRHVRAFRFLLPADFRYALVPNERMQHDNSLMFSGNFFFFFRVRRLNSWRDCIIIKVSLARKGV